MSGMDNQQIRAGIVGDVRKALLDLDLCFAPNEQPDAEIQRACVYIYIYFVCLFVFVLLFLK
jgi:hypothetical protein